MSVKKMVWNFEAQNIPYRVELENKKVSINNAEPVKLNLLSTKSSLLGTDYSIPIGVKEAVLHIGKFGAPVLSYNGRDCTTGEEYIPAKMPGWAWVFIILHAINFFVLIGGALGGGIQALVIMLMAAIASNPKMSTGVRVLICTGILIVSSAAQYALALGFALIM